ncbi:lysine--tRNA ligase [bacterium]|nr:lysine--tRNA ligase [bacterium]
MEEINDLVKIRKEKLTLFREAGINPYPYSFARTHKANNIFENFDAFTTEDKVSLAGRIASVRVMGKAAFCVIADDSAKIQLYVTRDNVGEENYAIFKKLDIGDFIGVKGYVFKTKTGEISIHADSYELLSKSIRPLPIVKEKDGVLFDAFADKELRFRKRYLDLIVNPEVKATFVKRTKIIGSIRKFLDENGFLEVETPILQPLYGGASARPFTTHHNSLDRTLYLRIADELYLKRLIIGGFERVYEVCKNFRNEGMDKTHNPEFTAVEFYWAYADYCEAMDFVEELFRFVAEKSIGVLQFHFGNNEINLGEKFQRATMSDLIKTHAGIEILGANEQELYVFCKSKNLEVKENFNYGQFVDEIFSEFVEPKLIQPTFILDYPKAISPLAKAHRSGDERIVERWELFIAGKEFANCFSELNDPLEQRERLEEQAKLREKGDEEAQPVDEDFLEAMEYGMPPTAGVGIGIDRLVMLLTNNDSIKDVLLFPQMREQKDN